MKEWKIKRSYMRIIAAGNPCKVIREITEDDRKYYYKNYEFDVKDYLLIALLGISSSC